MSPVPDLSRPRRVHVVGIGGAGMSAIATVLHGSGHTVTGSDLADSAVADRLRALGVDVAVGHAADQIGDAELVVISTAIPDTNPEVVAARERGIPVHSRADALAALTAEWRTISVAGTHGKTTTSAMVSAVLHRLGLDPAFIVGGELLDLGTGAALGSSDWLVVEADESDGTFVRLDTDVAVVTNVEPDHLEHYGGFDALVEAFERFGREASRTRIVCLDDPGAARLAERLTADGFEVVGYGQAETADYRIVEPLPSPAGISFGLVTPAGRFEVSLGQPGMYNARNGTAAVAAAVATGADTAAAVEALSSFGGVGRRFEPRGEAGGVRLFDDYAHLPTEVASALSAARSLGAERLVAVFQPHRYSRTQQLGGTFGDAFVDADVIFVTGIYAATEAPRPGVTGRIVVDAVLAAHPDADVRYVEERDALSVAVADELRPGDLCLTLGAGDLTTLPTELVARLEAR